LKTVSYFPGKWLPEEERLLAQAVYDLSGCEPGTIPENITTSSIKTSYYMGKHIHVQKQHINVFTVVISNVQKYYQNTFFWFGMFVHFIRIERQSGIKRRMMPENITLIHVYSNSICR
jgi:hypothetical protein